MIFFNDYSKSILGQRNFKLKYIEIHSYTVTFYCGFLKGLKPCFSFNQLNISPTYTEFPDFLLGGHK